RDRPARSDQGGELLHERLPRAAVVIAPPDPLPPHDPHPRRAGHVMKQPASTATAGRDDPARRAPGRRGGTGDGDDQQPIPTVNMFDMDAAEAEQQVATRTRAEGRARISAPRSRVGHVEVLVMDQGVSASDPPGPRPLPPNHHPASPTPTGCPKSPISAVVGLFRPPAVHRSDRDVTWSVSEPAHASPPRARR